MYESTPCARNGIVGPPCSGECLWTVFAPTGQQELCHAVPGHRIVLRGAACGPHPSGPDGRIVTNRGVSVKGQLNVRYRTADARSVARPGGRFWGTSSIPLTLHRGYAAVGAVAGAEFPGCVGGC